MSLETLKSPRRSKPVRRLKQIAVVVAALPSHLELVRTINKSNKTFRLNIFSPDFCKYTTEYIALNMNIRQRRIIIRSHHDWEARFTNSEIPRGIVIWRTEDGDQQIILRRAQRAMLEGEVELAFTYLGETVYTLSFSICVASELYPEQEGLSLLVGGLQGLAKSGELLRKVAKMNGEIHPADLLLIACKAFALEAGVARVVGFPGELNIARARYDAIRMDYDRFWTDHLATLGLDGLYLLDPSCEKDPNDPVSSNHPARTRKKRARRIAFKQEVQHNLVHQGVVTRYSRALSHPIEGRDATYQLAFGP